jgi:alpha-ketoglutarate-dependent taurine dioxygenase
VPGFETNLLSDAAGVEIIGADLTQPLPDSDAAALKALFERHRLLLFRGQYLTDEQHVRACNYVLPALPNPGFVSNTEVKGFDRDCLLLFHSDFAFTAYPLLGISLHAQEIAPNAAPTRFCNTQKAYEAMPSPLRERMESLQVLMLANTVDGREDIAARTIRVPDDAPRDRYIRIVRPVISEHRVTHTPFILASEQQASHFDGLSLAESDQLLAELFGHMYRDEFVYDHDWAEGDLIVWDNLTLQHGRRANPGTVRRCLRKVMMNEKTQAEVLAGTVYAPAVPAS